MPYARVKNELPLIPGYSEGAIAYASDAAAAPLNKCICYINPVQSGSGDPSPSNIRPITGYTELNLVHTGTNLWDEEWEVGGINGTTGQNDDNVTNRIRSKNYIPVPQAELYLCAESGSTYNIYEYDSNKSFLRVYGKSANTKLNITADASYIRFLKYSPNTTTYNHDISINYPSTDTSYHAYTGSTTTTDLGTTVYGGTLDVKTGVLMVTKGYIASYDGETLPSDWICDRAVYESGTTPPTGSQVVYTLATPITTQLTPQEVKTILGNNNIFADSGDIDIIYIRRSGT